MSFANSPQIETGHCSLIQDLITFSIKNCTAGCPGLYRWDTLLLVLSIASVYCIKSLVPNEAKSMCGSEILLLLQLMVLLS